ncbi:MAG TPA: TIGR00282 family metallophosphoesterase [Kiritimatiellia bacterium]|nr:TIGR00282 family metallophosphoesterase [Kiritimatiellia bacterium]
MRILHVGDIVGSPGRNAFQRIAIPMKQEGLVDAIIVNAENSAAGRGITPSIAETLLNAGADVITLGDHTWDQKDIYSFLDLEPRIIRPLNFAPGCPGRGWTTLETPGGSFTVISIIGRVFMNPYDCPFRAIDALLRQHADFPPVIMVEIHAEATSEKIAIGRYLDGRVSSVVGTHTHVQTSDETILPKGTAYLTDLGMTGPKDSVLGRDLPTILSKFLNGMPVKFEVAKDLVALEGAIIEIDPRGRATSITRVREILPPAG